MPVNSAQFQRAVGSFNNQKLMTYNMCKSFFSDIALRQCHITTSHACSPLVLLKLVLYLRFIFPPRQFKI